MEKKIVGLVMAVLLLFLLAACNLPKENEMYTLLESSSCCPEIEQSSLYEGNIVLSTEAYEEAITHFMTAEDHTLMISEAYLSMKIGLIIFMLLVIA